MLTSHFLYGVQYMQVTDTRIPDFIIYGIGAGLKAVGRNRGQGLPFQLADYSGGNIFYSFFFYRCFPVPVATCNQKFKGRVERRKNGKIPKCAENPFIIGNIFLLRRKITFNAAETNSPAASCAAPVSPLLTHLG